MFVMATAHKTHGGPVDAVTLRSTRFGELEIPAEAVLEFPNGLIGLGGSRYTLLARSDEAMFVWLHSVDDPAIAIPLTNPWKFFEDYAVDLSDADVDRMGITDPSEAQVYVTVRAAEAIEDFTANLRAPILLVSGRGFQVINQAPDTPVRVPLLAGIAEGAGAGQAA
jgi:flagellar assembly factor FliW